MAKAAGKIVRIRTGSRLHFGLIESGDRRHGGCGLMIDAPGIALTVGRSRMSMVRGTVDDSIRNRAQRLLHQISKSLALPRTEGFVVEIERCAAEHVGLGTGTQLSLAVARGVCEWLELPMTAESLAKLAGRGRRSAIGAHGFVHGGFVVDGGKSAADELGMLVKRLDFPVQWPIVLLQANSNARWHGSSEEEAFARLSAGHSTDTSAQMQALLDDRIVPAIDAVDYAAFAEAIHEFNRLAGEFFADSQTGTYSDPVVAQLIDRLRTNGARAVGQSSWGPTIFAIADSELTARQWTESISGMAPELVSSSIVVAAMNQGAQCARDAS